MFTLYTCRVIGFFSRSPFVSSLGYFSSSIKNKLMLIHIILLASVLSGIGYAFYELGNVSESQTGFIIINIGILIGALIGLSIAVLYFGKIISKPIKNAANITKQISEGNLNVSISKINSTNEINDLTNSLDNMITSLRQLVMDVNVTANKVARDARDSAAATEELNSSVEEVSTTVQQIATGSQSQASELAEAKTIVDAVMDTNSKEDSSASEKMSRIIELTNESSNKVKNLAAKSEKITSVVEVIREISEKTNLLALNAAIEAARAGESGRGFAVVADEVRRLAEGSAKSLEEIDKLIGEIQEDIHTTVASIDGSASEIEEGRKVVESSLKALSKIGYKVQEVAAVAEQNAFATDQAYAAVEQQTTATQEISSSSQNIALMAENLAKKVSTFKIPNSNNSTQLSTSKLFRKNTKNNPNEPNSISEFEEATNKDIEVEEKIES